MRWARARPDRFDRAWLKASRRGRGNRAVFCNPPTAHRWAGGSRMARSVRLPERLRYRRVIWSKGHLPKKPYKSPYHLVRSNGLCHRVDRWL
jgi:hypothetical protein